MQRWPSEPGGANPRRCLASKYDDPRRLLSFRRREEGKRQPSPVLCPGPNRRAGAYSQSIVKPVNPFGLVKQTFRVAGTPIESALDERSRARRSGIARSAARKEKARSDCSLRARGRLQGGLTAGREDLLRSCRAPSRWREQHAEQGRRAARRPGPARSGRARCAGSVQGMARR